MKGEELTASYQRALDALDETTALLRVGLSPSAATMNAVLIVLREGLEAVVILAALLADLRGPENSSIRRLIGWGAVLALVATAVLFIISRYFIVGLSKYGETLEIVISSIAPFLAFVYVGAAWLWVKFSGRSKTASVDEKALQESPSVA